VFRQNQFGGTLGGPVKHQKVYFFGDYQGTRTNEGVETGDISVPSIQDRSGNLSDIADSLTGKVSGPTSRACSRKSWVMQSRLESSIRKCFRTQ
jgi:hypothetical protein